jgi:5-methylcytosine-specific restriction endonuclease McrBC regulatory subunit McrC
LLLNNQKIRHVIDTITSKVVLILGRFTPERKAVLDAIRKELRQRDRLPVLFDFEKPTNRTTEETVSTLAHMVRFVIADLTDAKSVLQELRSIVPNSPSVIV